MTLTVDEFATALGRRPALTRLDRHLLDHGALVDGAVYAPITGPHASVWFLRAFVDRHLTNYCETCDRWFPSRRGLNLHRARSVLHSTDRVPCDVCGREFLNEFGRDVHKRRSHL